MCFTRPMLLWNWHPMLLWKSSHVTMEMVVITIWFTDTSNPYIKK